MKLTTVITEGKLKLKWSRDDMLALQQEVIERLHDDDWDVSLSEEKLIMQRGEHSFSYSFKTRMITIAKPKFSYEVEFNEYPEEFILALSALVDMYAKVSKLVGYKSFKLEEDEDDSGELVLRFDKTIQGGVLFKVYFDGEAWVCNANGENEEGVEDFAKLDAAIHWIEKIEDDPSNGLIW
jgi:hypothetical protein